MVFIGSITASYHRFRGPICVPHLLSILLPTLLFRLRRSVRERLLEVCYDILDVFRTNRQPDEVLSQVGQMGKALAQGGARVKIHTGVTPELIFSSSLSCSCVVVQG